MTILDAITGPIDGEKTKAEVPEEVLSTQAALKPNHINPFRAHTTKERARAKQSHYFHPSAAVLSSTCGLTHNLYAESSCKQSYFSSRVGSSTQYV